MLWIILAFMAGTTLGVSMMALLSAGKYDDIMNNRIE